MTSNCLIDGTMTANFETIYKTAVTLTAQQNYKKMKYYQQYKANRIRPVSPQGGFVLYCSEHRFCKAKTDGGNAERG